MRRGNGCAGALVFAAAVLLLTTLAQADEQSTRAQYEAAKANPWLMRQLLHAFPKGGDLHNHLDGSIYAEHIIKWAADDGKCVTLATGQIGVSPCSAQTGKPAMASIVGGSDDYRRLVDLYSVRNYERRSASGHDQFFNTFDLFFPGTLGHEGAMLAEVALRRGLENTVYLELMQSWGMTDAAKLAAGSPGLFTKKTPVEQLAKNPALAAIAVQASATLTTYEKDWHAQAGCGTASADAGCGVTVRYLAQVIRVLPPEQVYAQIALAFLLASTDARYAGINLVAPEDDPAALSDYEGQMQEIHALSHVFPQVKVTLHAGELGPGLVAPENTHDHIRKAVMIAGALRIGHGVDIGVEDDALDLLRYMARHKILVEINLTSNAVIAGLAGPDHPFELYRRFHVPLALSADDEGVLRIDLTHEYVRAALTYALSYTDLKELSRNALAYGFMPGESLLTDTRTGLRVKACRGPNPAAERSTGCQQFVQGSPKAQLQLNLEKRFAAFEAAH